MNPERKDTRHLTPAHGADPRFLAAEVIRRVLDEEAFAAAVLSSQIDRYPQLDPRERALITELVYGTLRAARYLEGSLGRYAKKGLGNLDATTRSHLWVASYQITCLERIPAYAAVSSAVSFIKQTRGPKLAAFANALLRALSREVEATGRTAPIDALVAGAPRWLLRALDQALGIGQGAAFLAAGPIPPPVGLRVRKGARAEWVIELRQQLPQATITEGQISPACLLVQSGGDPRRWPGVSTGDLIVQEEGSQWVAEKVGAQVGEHVLDACAGRGNKTIVLADAVGAQGQIDVADLYPDKLDRLRERAEQMGVTLGQRFAVDWSLGSADIPENSYDRVLLDAPCSGTGTLRRRPEILLRRKKDDLTRFCDLQSSMVRHASRVLRPGGALFYAVCSVLSEEMEDVIGAVEGLQCQSIERIATQVTGTDGYAIAKLVRTLIKIIWGAWIPKTC